MTVRGCGCHALWFHSFLFYFIFIFVFGIFRVSLNVCVCVCLEVDRHFYTWAVSHARTHRENAGTKLKPMQVFMIVRIKITSNASYSVALWELDLTQSSIRYMKLSTIGKKKMKQEKKHWRIFIDREHGLYKPPCFKQDVITIICVRFFPENLKPITSIKKSIPFLFCFQSSFSCFHDCFSWLPIRTSANIHCTAFLPPFFQRVSHDRKHFVRCSFW